ncbi:MAG: helix-turn-helix domain-containing protein [Candidatus Shapirobacteria bacterium]
MTEADYICFLAKDITLGYFQDGGYYVLPYFDKHKKSVYFPDLNYSNKFWRLITNSKSINLGDEFPKEAIDEIKSKVEPKSSRTITHEGITIELLETEYGTRGSYYQNIMTQRKGNNKEDFEKTFTMMKLLLINKDKAEIGNMVWHKRNAVVEYLFGAEKFNNSVKLTTDSNKYLEKLGFYKKLILPKLNSLTIQEEKVWELLQNNAGEIVSFDQVANALWQDKVDDKFSLEAMAKVIENLRKKVRESGINKEMIFTKRGKGYILIN